MAYFITDLDDCKDESMKDYLTQRIKFSSHFTDKECSTLQGIDEFAHLYLKTKDEKLFEEIKNYILWVKIMTLSNSGYFCQCMSNKDWIIPLTIAQFVQEKAKTIPSEYLQGDLWI